MKKRKRVKGFKHCKSLYSFSVYLYKMRSHFHHCKMQGKVKVKYKKLPLLPKLSVPVFVSSVPPIEPDF